MGNDVYWHLEMLLDASRNEISWLALTIAIAMIIVTFTAAILAFQRFLKIKDFVTIGLAAVAVIAGYIVLSIVWGAYNNKELTISEHCPFVLEGIRSGEIAVLTDRSMVIVEKTCGEMEVIRALNDNGVIEGADEI